LQQLTEFDCFVKSFTYLAARLPRSVFLESFLDEATVEPIESMKQQMGAFTKMQDLSKAAEKMDVNAIMAGMQLATCRPSEAALQAGDVPLSKSEPDMYPCLLAMCGSGFGFMKVNVTLFHRHFHFVKRLVVVFLISSLISEYVQLAIPIVAFSVASPLIA